MNIYDISQKAGVSIATVSRVLNGSEKVSEKNPKKSACCHGRKQLHTKCLCQKSRTEFHAHCWDSLFRLLGRFTRHRQFIIWSGSFARIPMHPCSAAQGVSFWRNRAI